MKTGAIPAEAREGNPRSAADGPGAKASMRSAE